MDLDPCLLAQPSVRRRKGPGHWMVYPDSHRSGAEARHCQLPLLPSRSGFELNPDRWSEENYRWAAVRRLR